MDVRFVETLLAAVEEGSLAGAARRLGITAAAVSQRVAALEAELSVPLLVRAGRQMAPTPDCEALLTDLRQMVALHAGLAAKLNAEQLRGTLRLGAVSTALSDFGPQLVSALEVHAPEVALSLIPAPSDEIYGKFVDGHLDAALIVAPPFALPKTMTFERLARQPVGLLRPRDAQKSLPYVLYKRTAWGGALCWQALQAHDPAPRILCEMDAVEIIAQMVADGLGQAVLPKWAGLARYQEELDFVPLGAAYRDVGLLTWRRDARRPVIALMRDILRQKP
ncbi:LysR family transcriptional regulator [Shimia sp. R9_1]|uniref:LysR family transcriptional regulator n=1 Tax=Shimia sp. R9_1 TaxID=2821111 RepID=UPI001ADA7EFB|nr:LysR family transcriptional regulator [Shimia sp. R9_1]MBO9406287.1 LysR family transcriptional regulator [Shimia sp. R9_1]